MQDTKNFGREVLTPQSGGLDGATDKAAKHWVIGIVGYGEVGRILAEDLRAQGVRVHAYDVKLDVSQTAAALKTHAQALDVALADSSTALAAGCDLVISAVTASQAVTVARACAPGLRTGTFFLDLNSVSPGAKEEGARVITQAGGRFVEGAVMTSVPPYRIKVPLLLGGLAAPDLVPKLSALGFDARVASETLGVASATKMCRSVMIKGLEAMVIESLSTARRYGVEDAVIASLGETFPHIDWERQAAYFFQRVIEHGRRRSEEMREAAQTVREAGLPPSSAEATANTQAWVADLADAGVFGVKGGPGFARNADWRIETDHLLAALGDAS